MKFDNRFCGSFLAIQPEEPSHATASHLIDILSPPLGAAHACRIITLIAQSLASVQIKLKQPNQLIRAQTNAVETLADLMRNRRNPQSADAPSALRGKRSSYPVWTTLANIAASKTPPSPLIRLGIGCEVLLAMHAGRTVPRVFAQHLMDMLDLSMSDTQIDALLVGNVPGEYMADGWTDRLSRNWIQVVTNFSSDTPPDPPIRQRINGQLLGSTLNSSVSHKAGVMTTRNITTEQLHAVCAIAKAPKVGHVLKSLFIILVMRTSLSVDVLAKLPVIGNAAPGKEHGLLPRLGCVYIDISIVVFEPARPINGCYSGGTQVRIDLPGNLADLLRSASASHPTAETIADLFPDESTPKTEDPILSSRTELIVNWAKLRHATAPYLLASGFNALHAALLTLDFGLICRSKLHYACVTPFEWLDAESQLYALLELADSNQDTCGLQGIGCRVVPHPSVLQLHDTLLQQQVIDHRAGRHSSLARLVDHHNAFTQLTGWRLSMLMALRASQRIEINASLEATDRYTAYHDKHTPGDRGWQLIPVCNFARVTIKLYKHHCQSLAERVAKVATDQHPISKWATAVADGKNMRLLGVITPRMAIEPLASQAFTTALSTTYELPPDPGRKTLENHLRWAGLPASHIDAVLRHTIAGQIRPSSTSTFDINSWIDRVEPAIESIAVRLFGSPIAGLRRG